MRIDCPHCGFRDSREFSYLGDAETAIGAPWGKTDANLDDETNRVYLRDNPAGAHTGLWYHDAGCRSWLTIERDTRTHEVLSVALAGGDAG